MKIYSCVLFLGLLGLEVSAIIPRPCATRENFASGVCCPEPTQLGSNPGRCGVNLGRGSCVKNTGFFNPNERDVRKDWPIKYFSSTCKCGERYGGYDCGECSFGYNDGTNECQNKTILPRFNVKDMSDEDWVYYRSALRRVKDNQARYVVARDLYPEGTREEAADKVVDSLVDVSTYDLFVWLHHFVAKDNNDNDLGTSRFTDFAHEGTGFPTWHRLLLLWIEREIQVEITNHTFRLPFWDWTDPSQREYLFTDDKLGDNNRLPDGNLFGDSWKMRCWRDPDKDLYRSICDPTQPSINSINSIIPLRRCPDPSLCERGAQNWPTEKDVEDALCIETYDSNPYDRYVTGTRNSFRNFMEGFVVGTSDCKGENLCSHAGNNPQVTRKLHNTVHIILGLGDLSDKNTKERAFDKQGVMSCVAASPNDPVFINHHANIDCILEKWLQKNKDATYPDSKDIREGHRKSDYIVPFIPLYTHNDMFRTADYFGYSTCSAISVQGMSATIYSLMLAVILLIL